MVARAKDTRFQNLTVDYHKIMDLSPSRRTELVDTTEGRSLLSKLTAQQLQSAFPYNSKRDDDINEKLKSIMTGSAQQPQVGDKPQLSPNTREKLSGRNRSDPGAKAQLTKEQKETFELLQKGDVAADDPRVGFLKQVSDNDLKKFGINKVTTDDGKQSFKMDPTKASQVPDEELAASIKSRSSVSGSPYLAEQRRKFIDELSADPALSDKFMRAMRAEAGSRKEKLSDVMEATFNRATMNGKTMAQEIGPAFFGPIRNNHPNFTKPLSVSERQSATDALSDVGQGRNRIQLRTDQGMVTDPGGRIYEKMPDKSGKLNFGDGNNYYFMGDKGRKFFASQEKARQEYDALHSKSDGPVTPEQLAAERTRLANDELSKRQSGLASIVGKKTTTSSQSNVYYAGDSIGVGVGTAAGGINLAKSGMKFTEPALLQQLARVPKGSTVELHGGTNDAVAGVTNADVYREQMKKIAELAKANGITVNVNGPPKSTKPWDKDASTIDAALAAAAQEHGLNFRSLKEFVPPTKSDGVHFSNEGYQSMIRPLAAPQQVAEVIPTMPDGGEMTTDADQLQVYALDKNKLQRDDSIALDGNGKPQFTMNSKESMKFDPNTGRVEVDNGSRGYRNDPNQLGPEQRQSQSQKALEERSVPQPTQPQAPPMPTTSVDNGSHNSMYESVNLTQNIFKTPSFERAMARSRFHNTGDAALGGNFDGGAYGMV